MNSFIDRVSSYNCGKNINRIHGTASTTNWFILQSLLKINKEANIYYFQPEPLRKIYLWNEEYIATKPSYKIAENIVIKEYIKQFGKKPQGNTQK
jgi:hypothetical protein